MKCNRCKVIANVGESFCTKCGSNLRKQRSKNWIPIVAFIFLLAAGGLAPLAFLFALAFCATCCCAAYCRACVVMLAFFHLQIAIPLTANTAFSLVSQAGEVSHQTG